MCELLKRKKRASNEGEGQNTDRDGLVVVEELKVTIYIIYSCTIYVGSTV